MVTVQVRHVHRTCAPMMTWAHEPGSFSPLVHQVGRKRYAVVADHLGTPQMLIDEQGTVAWEAQLDVYGVPIEEEGEVAQPWRYPGQLFDEETGLCYNRHRYYDPETGRYISEDPIGLLGGLVLHGYVGDTLGWIDPFGLACRVAYRADADRGGLKLGRVLSEKQALARLRRGQNVFADKMSEAKSLAKRAIRGKPMFHRPHEPGYFPHFHPAQHANDSHVFFRDNE